MFGNTINHNLIDSILSRNLFDLTISINSEISQFNELNPGHSDAVLKLKDFVLSNDNLDRFFIFFGITDVGRLAIIRAGMPLSSMFPEILAVLILSFCFWTHRQFVCRFCLDMAEPFKFDRRFLLVILLLTLYFLCVQTYFPSSLYVLCCEFLIMCCLGACLATKFFR